MSSSNSRDSDINFSEGWKSHNAGVDGYYRSSRSWFNRLFILNCLRRAATAVNIARRVHHDSCPRTYCQRTFIAGTAVKIGIPRGTVVRAAVDSTWRCRKSVKQQSSYRGAENPNALGKKMDAMFLDTQPKQEYNVDTYTRSYHCYPSSRYRMYVR